ncbi:hypothetical protein SAPIO_CDS10517 [Scedosporium apiospermum]|uniref:Uncharacterized protein n=1 Tax=Pseudallescheria apiosperma TaxID=563466 RepID=A0A084FVL2_PSEDA|nr:uncharacterized protein SAPIO_CDS10517 [Scedosporium apiospermum]KEZ39124.1 hypothetical protein SAPIO_CDS10517 [Scedosporium apiospermum]
MRTQRSSEVPKKACDAYLGMYDDSLKALRQRRLTKLKAHASPSRYYGWKPQTWDEVSENARKARTTQ